MIKTIDLKKPDSGELLRWYDRHARVLPWRINPERRKKGEIPDPYKVWLSEIMLQQTTVATVKSYYHKFTTRWPTLADLAKADREDILKAWAGLGYYSRARNLKTCAELIMDTHNGVFPSTITDLKALPGIGDYTSSALASIAFDKPETVVDGNVERVIARLFAIEEPLPKAKTTIKQKAQQLTPKSRPGDYAQAMMDLGATICTPKRPACPLCVWKKSCAAFETGNQESFPRKAPKLAKPTRYGMAFVAVRQDGHVLLRKRPDKGLLGGMSEIPGTDWSENKPLNPYDAAPYEGEWPHNCGTIKHTFTHFHLEIIVVKTTFHDDQPAAENCWWAKNEDIPHEALPTVMKKIIEAALPGLTKKNR